MMKRNKKLKNSKVLILDDEKAICELIRDILRDVELDISETYSLKGARELLFEKKFELIIVDYNVSDGIGWSLIEEIASDTKKYGKPSMLFISGTVDFSFFENNYSDWKIEFIPKPFGIFDFKDRVVQLLSAD